MTPYGTFDDDLLVRQRPRGLARSVLDGWTPSVQTIAGLVRAWDLLAMVLAGVIAHAWVRRLSAPVPAGAEVVLMMAALAVANVVLRTLRAYQPTPRRQAVGSIARRGCGLFAGTGAMVSCAALLPLEPGAATLFAFCWLAASLALAAAGHTVVAARWSRWHEAGCLARRVAVVGLNEHSAGFLDRLSRAEAGVEVVGLYRDDDDAHLAEHAGHPVMGRIEDIVAHGQRSRIDAVVLAMPLTQPERIARAQATLRMMVCDIYATAGLAGLRYAPSQMQDLGSNAVVNISPRALDERQAMRKAVFDRCAGALLLLLLSPLLAIIALLIKCTSAGPVLFAQPRLGFNNMMFTIYKFRTMYEADADLLADRQTTRGDARVTPLGRILRNLSLDELPQLLNVLNGSMSLVGPRPHAPNTKAANQLFQDVVANYPVRHRVKPGMTGWAQINGWRGETKTVEHIRQRVAYDLFYIDNWSLAFDLRIMFLTVKREIFSSTAF